MLSASRLDFSEATVRIEVQGSVVDSVRQVGQPLSMKGRFLLAIDMRLIWDGLAMEAKNQCNLAILLVIYMAVRIIAGQIDIATYQASTAWR